MSINRNVVLQRKLTEIAVFANSLWAVLKSFLLADGRYLGISQQLSNIL
jgi:hypothetical protein